MKTMFDSNHISRRHLLQFAGGAAICGAIPIVTVRSASATPATMASAIRDMIGEAPLKVGKVRLEIPPLVENGNTVPMTVSVESPMTKDNYVKAIHVFNEKNPQANVISTQLSPRAGKAAISTRIRLAGTQKLMAVAELSDGSYWSDTADVVVTLAACLEDLTP